MSARLIKPTYERALLLIDSVSLESPHLRSSLVGKKANDFTYHIDGFLRSDLEFSLSFRVKQTNRYFKITYNRERPIPKGFVNKIWWFLGKLTQESKCDSYEAIKIDDEFIELEYWEKRVIGMLLALRGEFCIEVPKLSINTDLVLKYERGIPL